MSTHPRRRRLLALAAVALLAVGGAACSDDGDGGEDATTTTSTTEAPSSTDESSSTTGEDGATPTTEEGDEESPTTTEDPGDPVEEEALASRLPEIEGYERSAADDDTTGFDDELCDGSTPSVSAAEEVSADYNLAGGGGGGAQDLLSIGAGHFASEDEAAAFFEEFTSTTAGCTSNEVTVSESTDTGIGDEGQSFEITFATSGGGGAVYVSLLGDEVWFLSQFAAAAVAEVPEVVVDAFRTAVEG